MNKILLIIKSLRIKQWVKNLFIFIPLIFGNKLLETNNIISSLLVFIVFCLLSSSIYLLNDIKDKNIDSLHPIKKLRPIASNLLPIPMAYITAFFLIVSSILITITIDFALLKFIIFYILLHLLYIIRVKNEDILDVIFIAFGFELRIWTGSIVLNLNPSIWLQLCVFVLALFLGFLKRKHEKFILKNIAIQHRSVLSEYNNSLIDQLVIISGTLCIFFYGFYSVSKEITSKLGNTNMAYTIIFVIYGIFRYLYLVHNKKVGGDPGEILLSDFPIILNILLWIFSIVILIYIPL